jgi:flagellar hook protein FlgE
VDGSLPNANIGPEPDCRSLNFSNTGLLDAPAMPWLPRSLSLAGQLRVAFTLDYSGSTQFGSPVGVNNLTQNGFTSGRLAGSTLPTAASSWGATPGQTRNLGQVVLADFATRKDSPSWKQPVRRNR